jgi:sterol desaturase/sphingolipid hydroxylase (fatty acid hydroxylase superfamily)
MTPATAARVHPLEDVLLSNIIAVVLGAVYGLSSYVLGAGAHELTLFEVNVVFVAFYLTTYHLRHSHVWLRVPRPLAYVLHSPAHHQIHHSADPAHFDRNLGFALSLWDWAFGTLHVPGARRPAAFGIGAESKDYSSVGRLFLLPFVKIARAWRPRAGAMADPR